MLDDQDEFGGLLTAIDQVVPPAPVLPPQPTASHDPGRLYRFWRDDWGMDVEPQPHIEMAGFIDGLLGDRSFSGNTQTLAMLGVPRGSFKTTGIEATCVEILTRNSNAKILLDGFRHSVAKARLRAIRRKVENDPHLHDHYRTQEWKPIFREDIWNDAEISIQTRTDFMSREASIATAGVDRSMNSQHFDVIFPDDVVTDTNVQTAEGRERVYQHILDLLPILNPGGVLLLIFTTWHIDDAYMRLIRIDQERERRGLAPRFKKLIRGAYDGPNGLYFPARLTHEFLEEQRETLASRKFSAQYLLKPIADEDKTFNLDAMRLRPFSFFSTRERYFGGIIRLGDADEQLDVETTLAWDPAGRKANRTSDAHGVTVVGTDDLDVWWLLEALALKGPPTEIIARLCRLLLIYRPWAVSVEDTFGSGLWLDLLADECGRRGIATSFKEFSTGGVPKNERIALLQPRWEHGDLILRADADGKPVYPGIIRQFDRHSMGSLLDHEDELDSLVQHRGLTRKPEALAIVYDPNPPDAEYLAFRSRQLAEQSPAPRGRYGPTWTTGRAV